MSKTLDKAIKTVDDKAGRANYVLKRVDRAEEAIQEAIADLNDAAHELEVLGDKVNTAQAKVLEAKCKEILRGLGPIKRTVK